MNVFFEIAYAAVSNHLCLLTGTGFSKAVTENEAFGWQELLEEICDGLSNNEQIKSSLFPSNQKYSLSLEESAQIIDIELSKLGKDIHYEIAQKVRAICLAGDNTAISGFFQNFSIEVITTNYDKLVEELSGTERCHSITPGFPVPRTPSQIKVYHIHGSIDSPQNMVVTSDDYFKFINEESYFSRKLSTALHENTVVILGYSLGDTNLKAIINDYKNYSKQHVITGNLFFVSKDAITQNVKDYYAHCYGIRVLDNLELTTFFRNVTLATPLAQRCIGYSNDILNVIRSEECAFNDDYLRIEYSFFEILAAISASGGSINNPFVVKALGVIINKKIGFSSQYNAWDQYEHLAKWLIHLGSILELSETSIKDIYLAAVFHSMSRMSKIRYIGYSWHAYSSWSNGWSNIKASNRLIIKSYIEEHLRSEDPLEIVSRG